MIQHAARCSPRFQGSPRRKWPAPSAPTPPSPAPTAPPHPSDRGPRPVPGPHLTPRRSCLAPARRAPRAAGNLPVDPATGPGGTQRAFNRNFPALSPFPTGAATPRRASTPRTAPRITSSKKGIRYVKPGDPASGLLPDVFRIEGLANGQGDRGIQGYTHRVRLTTGPTLRIPIEKPAGDPAIDHEWLLRHFEAGDDRRPALIEPLARPGAKLDGNNLHAVSSDLPGANGDEPEASDARRREIEPEHETCLRGFLWTLSHSPRVSPSRSSTVKEAWGRVSASRRRTTSAGADPRPGLSASARTHQRRR